jgi:uncharacterized protein (DUF1800 family)
MTISAELIALNRIGYGPRPAQSPLVANPAAFQGDLARIAALGGLNAYIEQQLSPATIDDSYCNQQIAAVQFRSANGVTGLGQLSQTPTNLWGLTDFGMSIDWSERMRPWNEVRIATIIRAIYSERQLQEIMVDFWHNHFNVNASGDVAHSVGFPTYDQTIRQNCFGNFGSFVEEIAKSIAMLYYLDNYSNRASGGEGGNENYARELFELHTLGSDNYLKFYDDRSQVGTTTYNGETFVRGYIDKDVYEAAECLTGWTVANGDWRLPTGTPDDGTFIYVPSWHSGGTKIVMNKIVDNGQSSSFYMKDGRDVLKLITEHIGTARFICRKLVRRLVADFPPENVVEAAVAEWMANRQAPDQIKRVVRVILQSDAFKTTWGQKVKRPFDYLVSYIRAAGVQLKLTDGASSQWNSLFYLLSDTGHRIFEWPTPTGHPDLASFWLSTNGLLRRWNLPYKILYWGPEAQADIVGQMPSNLTSTQIVDFWANRIFGYDLTPTTRTALISFIAQGGAATAPPRMYGGEQIKDRLECLVYLMAMSPEFQSR